VRKDHAHPKGDVFVVFLLASCRSIVNEIIEGKMKPKQPLTTARDTHAPPPPGGFLMGMFRFESLLPLAPYLGSMAVEATGDLLGLPPLSLQKCRW